MGIFRVSEKTRTVRAYNEDVVSEEDFDKLERYTKLGYKVVLVPKKPKQYNHIKKDMVKYLEGNIDNDIYNEFIDRVEKKQNFLKLKWWLVKELQDKTENEKITFEYVEEIINQAKSKESNLIENIKGQDTIENDKEDDEDKGKPNKNKEKGNKNK